MKTVLLALASLTLVAAAFSESPGAIDLLSGAETEISDYQALETLAVSQLKVRLTENDPRWDPWLRQISEPLPQIVISPVAPRRLAGYSLAVTGAFLIVFLAPSWWHGRRKLTDVLLVGSLIVTATFLLIPTTDTSKDLAKQAALFRQHLWYQTAYPYGVTWDDYHPGEPVTIAAVRRQGIQLVADRATVFTPDSAWEKELTDSLSDSNAARILGLDFP